jgi:hypothetical protein
LLKCQALFSCSGGGDGIDFTIIVH